MATERPRCGAHPAAAYLCFMTAPTSPCIITSTLSRPLMGWRGAHVRWIARLPRRTISSATRDTFMPS